jgi:hypothetical protein
MTAKEKLVREDLEPCGGKAHKTDERVRKESGGLPWGRAR